MEKKKTKKNKNSGSTFLSKISTWCIENKKMLIGFGAGLFLGLLIMIVTEDDEIATLKDGTQPVATVNNKTITADDLYKDMKNYYSIGILLNTIDNLIIAEKYPETDEMNEELEKEAQNYYDSYSSYYQMSKEEFLANNGFASHKDFIEFLRLDYRRNLAVEDYVKENLSEEEINKYYDEIVHGEINSKHILVKPDTTSEMTEDEINTKKEEALNLTKEIINKLNEGKTFDEVKEEYKDSIVYEELNFQPYNASLEQAYLDEMKNLEVGKYSTKPVETSYGYHIVYKIEQKEKPSKEEVNDTMLDELYQQKYAENTNLYNETLFKIREEKKLKFEDSLLEEKYKNYKEVTLN